LAEIVIAIDISILSWTKLVYSRYHAIIIIIVVAVVVVVVVAVFNVMGCAA
jgi:hypothetical protein